MRISLTFLLVLHELNLRSLVSVWLCSIALMMAWKVWININIVGSKNFGFRSLISKSYKMFVVTTEILKYIITISSAKHTEWEFSGGLKWMEVEELNKYSQVSVGLWMQHVSNEFLYLKNDELKKLLNVSEWYVFYTYWKVVLRSFYEIHLDCNKTAVITLKFTLFSLEFSIGFHLSVWGHWNKQLRLTQCLFIWKINVAFSLWVVGCLC